MNKETRTITQVRIYKLNLNPMTANVERSNLVAIAYNRQSLINWLKEQLAPAAYKDGQWLRVFKKDTPLENYNLPHCEEVFDESKIDGFPHGISDEWTTEEAIQNYIANAQASYGWTAVPELIEG